MTTSIAVVLASAALIIYAAIRSGRRLDDSTVAAELYRLGESSVPDIAAAACIPNHRAHQSLQRLENAGQITSRLISPNAGPHQLVYRAIGDPR
jgi:hypothetical protein